MPTTLELLRAEQREQATEEARTPIDTVDDARAVINSEHPAPNVNFSFEMCLLRTEESDRYWRLELINRSDENDFSKVLALYETLDSSRRSKFVFVLTVWKNRNDDFNHLEYRQGFSYRFDKVHSLKLIYGNPVGSIQIRHRLHADPLVSARVHAATGQPPASTEPATGVEAERKRSGRAGDSCTDKSLADPAHENQNGDRQTPPQTPPSRGEDTHNATPSAKSTTKRTTNKEDGAEPLLKKRKQSPKALCFESPQRTTRSK